MWTVVGAPLNSSARPGGEELGHGTATRPERYELA
jgi:hypothetical protein